MAYNFSTNSGKLIVTLDTESGKFSENINEYLQPNLVLGNDRVFLKEDGLFKQDFVFEAFGDIGGNTAENLVDAYNLLNALIIGISVNSIENAIPLSGTTVGNPVTGGIEVEEVGNTFWIKGTDYDELTNNLKLSFSLGEGGVGLNAINSSTGGDTHLLLSPGNIKIADNNIGAKGFSGNVDFSANITNLDYTQKIYVDGLRGKHISKTITEINAIVTPQAGETYFNTTLSTLCFWDGTAWKRVSNSAM